jgi:hypothetical protein
VVLASRASQSEEQVNGPEVHGDGNGLQMTHVAAVRINNTLFADNVYGSHVERRRTCTREGREKTL